MELSPILLTIRAVPDTDDGEPGDTAQARAALVVFGDQSKAMARDHPEIAGEVAFLDVLCERCVPVLDALDAGDVKAARAAASQIFRSTNPMSEED